MPRQRYTVRLRTDSPLLVGTTQSPGNYRRTENIVPGKAWRGAIADILRRNDIALFKALFLQPYAEQIHFGTLLPLYNPEASSPPPTRYACKRKRDEHGFFDTLARQYALEIALDQTTLPDRFDEMCCPVCGEVAEAETTIAFDDDIATLTTTHTAINRSRRVAEDTMLYTQEGALLKSAAISYVGWIDIPEQYTQLMEAFLDANRTLRIGGSRSRGMGQVTIEAFEPLSPSEALPDRVARFNQTLHNVLSFYRGQTKIDYPAWHDAEQNKFFTLNLRDEAIFLKDGVPSPIPELPSRISIVGRWTSWHNVGGWHTAARLPRRTHMSVSGVYLCRFSGTVDFAVLDLLESEGIGHLREQGYGQLYICDPSHYTKIGMED